MPLGAARSVLFVRGLGLTVLVVGLTIVGAGSAGASATTTAGSDQINPVALIFGVPLTTAAWAFLGLVLMVAGMVVSSRSNRRSARSLVGDRVVRGSGSKIGLGQYAPGVPNPGGVEPATL